MDPPHITEFASERYFNKLNQLNEPSDQSTTPYGQPSPAATSALQHPPQTSQSSFILPLRASQSVESAQEPSRVSDHGRYEKRRLKGLRSKVSFLHLKPSHQSQVVDEPRGAILPKRRHSTSQRFDQLFFALPNELQVQTLSSLPLHDILNLRQVSRSWHALVSLNESPIVRYHLDHHIPAYALRLYPIKDASTVNFHHLCGLWHRLHIATKLSFLMCEWITKEIFLRTTHAQRQEFAPQYERMRRRLIPLLFTIFHFFEMYRKLHLQHIVDNDGHGLSREPYTLNPIEVKIMNSYDDQTLLRVHQVFPLVISSFCRQLRPPTYVGRVERSIRGYLREKPPDEVHSAILCLGGLRQVERFWEIRGYNSRRGAVDNWYSEIIKEPPPDVPVKSRRGIMSLGRKKSSATAKERSSSQDGLGGNRRGSSSSADSVPSHMVDATNLVFNTSLSAGMPMAMLERAHVRRMLPDLPVLQQIWSTTAEALVLDRKVVERPQDIKRNAQVMLDLIKDDGMEEEDEWLYGKGTPDSVRPPLEAIEEDPIEGV